jgi:hypothetical protein
LGEGVSGLKRREAAGSRCGQAVGHRARPQRKPWSAGRDLGHDLGIEGECLADVALDIRRGSPTFGRWVGVELSADDGRQLWIPEGFAHGFAALSDHALVSYKCTAVYAAEAEGTVRWDDPELAIDWPLSEPIVSSKDASLPLLAELSEDDLPRPFESRHLRPAAR